MGLWYNRGRSFLRIVKDFRLERKEKEEER